MSTASTATFTLSDDPYTAAYQEFLRDLIVLELIPVADYIVPTPSYFLDKFAFYEKQIVAIAEENSKYLFSICVTSSVDSSIHFLNRDVITKLNLRHLHNLFKHVQNIFFLCKLQKDQSAEWVTRFYETMVRPNREKIEARIQEEETPLDMDLVMKDIQEMVAPMMEDPFLQKRMREDPLSFAREMQNDPLILERAKNTPYLKKLTENMPAFLAHVYEKQRQNKEHLKATGQWKEEKEEEEDFERMMSWIGQMKQHYVPPSIEGASHN